MTKTTRINAIHEGSRRSLFSVIHQDKTMGNLTIALRSKLKHRAHGTLINSASADPQHGSEITMTKISVHVSRESPENINVIKVSKLGDSGPTSYVINTRAIKQTHQFEILFGWRFSNLADSNYDPKKADAHIDIEYSPSKSTLCLMAFVAPHDRKFKRRPRHSDNFNWSQHTFGEFSILFIWSYLGIPGHESSIQVFAGSLPGRLSAGIDDITAVQVFNQQRTEWHHELARTLAQQPEYSKFIPLFRRARYFKTPAPGSEEWRAFGRFIDAFKILPSLQTRKD